MAPDDRSLKASSTYLEQEILAEDPLARIARIYEMARVHLSRARAALASADLAVKGRSVHQVSRCISLLQSSLDMERGGEVAANLDRLYGYMLGRLTEGHVNNDDRPLAEVLGHLTELGAAWREAAARRRTEPAAATAEPAAAARAVAR